MVTLPPEHKVNTQFDLPEMLSVYATHPNYEIVDFKNGDNRCFVFFSSNGLYYPNTPATFHSAIVENDRFEWKRNIPRYAGRVIFLRDVTKSWYIEGINTNIPNVDALASFLRLNTSGMEVICVGNSAGGYAATLFGCLINADHVFNMSGQYSLLHLLDNENSRTMNPTLVKYEHVDQYSKYFSIRELIAASGTPVFYFFPAKCDDDIVQSKIVETVDSVYGFAFDSSKHGATCSIQTYVHLLAQRKEWLMKLHSRFEDTVVSPGRFTIGSCGYARAFKFRVVPRAKKFMGLSPSRGMRT